MSLIRLGYSPKEKYKWKILSPEGDEYTYNDKRVIILNELLWIKVKNIMKVRAKGYDSLILIDGERRTGKSTLAKAIAYLLNPNLTINNYVSGLEEAPDKIERSPNEDVLIFDEGSLVANSKEVMTRKNVQLEKIIDIVGQKKLTLIFCMPSFFNISKAIAVAHSRFLIHVYTDKSLNRGRFLYFSTNKKKRLYELGKRMGSYKRPKKSFDGRFVDFRLPFEDEYDKLKLESLKEAFNTSKIKASPLDVSARKTAQMVEFKENCPNVTDVVIAKGFNMSVQAYYRRRRNWLELNPK